MEQDEVISEFLRVYNTCQPHNYQIARWPDRDNRSSRDCDAFAEAPGAASLAIEHTKVQTFNNQKLDSARFLKVCGELENELKQSFQTWVSMTVPVHAIQPGTNWNGIKETLRAWLLGNVDSLPLGRSDCEILGVPFRFTIHKHDSQSPVFTVGRWAPEEKVINAELVQIFKNALQDKDDQLRRYHETGATTILILESDDFSLVDRSDLYKGFLSTGVQLLEPAVSASRSGQFSNGIFG